tara:strand:+ start:32 stop:397 length:366 start_codon:yes stop_codon:yes gene_type:complete
MDKIRLIGGVFALLSVILGAFASHLFKKLIDEASLQSFEVGIRYLMFHGLALIILSLIPMEGKKIIYRFFIWGSILFSFSIFFLSLQSLIKLNLKWLGPVTPIGGTLLIIGWIIFIINSIK